MGSVALFYGPILLGAAVSLMLSGIVAVQCIIFFKLYPDESSLKTAMVATVWLLDAAQSAFILTSLFYYFVVHLGDTSAGNRNVILWSVAVRLRTAPVTAKQNCVVHLFSAEKICRCTDLRALLRNSRLILTKYVPASK
ncbi:hypothetical protein B0H14DRAFT_2675294 [Mycena olivaceomarginata]|nr:hypothetical protein B0H14DRAFT_2675294 [Mycena olivaceomarginata]